MIDPKQGFCPECGAKLVEKPLEGEGIIPFCPVLSAMIIGFRSLMWRSV